MIIFSSDDPRAKIQAMYEACVQHMLRKRGDESRNLPVLMIYDRESLKISPLARPALANVWYFVYTGGALKIDLLVRAYVYHPFRKRGNESRINRVFMVF